MKDKKAILEEYKKYAEKAHEERQHASLSKKSSIATQLNETDFLNLLAGIEVSNSKEFQSDGYIGEYGPAYNEKNDETILKYGHDKKISESETYSYTNDYTRYIISNKNKGMEIRTKGNKNEINTASFYQVTADGVYRMYITNQIDPFIRIEFYSNEDLEKISQHLGRPLETVIQEFASNTVEFNLPTEQKIADFSELTTKYKLGIDMTKYSTAEHIMLINKIFRTGLDKVFTDKDFSILKITEEDKKFYQDELEKINKKETLIETSSIEENKKHDITKQTEIPVHLEKISEEEKRKLQAYDMMEATGIVLSETQKEERDAIRTKEEKATKYEAYQSRASERKKHQIEAMHERNVANDAKNAEWEKSYAASKNKRAQELKELQLMRKQAEALRGVESLDPTLLTAEQKNLLSNNDRFVKAQDIANKHQNESGMNEEIRKIMAEYYEEQEKKGKSK